MTVIVLKPEYINGVIKQIFDFKHKVIDVGLSSWNGLYTSYTNQNCNYEESYPIQLRS